jgi:hypothetical protein
MGKLGKVSPKQTERNLQDTGAKPYWVESASGFERYVAYKVCEAEIKHHI